MLVVGVTSGAAASPDIVLNYGTGAGQRHSRASLTRQRARRCPTDPALRMRTLRRSQGLRLHCHCRELLRRAGGCERQATEWLTEFV